jgi:LPS-assembly lipoprotein
MAYRMPGASSANRNAPRRATLRLATGSTLRLALAATVLATALGGCGFKLRQNHAMAFKTMQLTGFTANSPLAAELARALEASGVDVVDSTLEATQAASSATVPITHLVLEGLADRRDMVASTTTAYGQVRTMTLRTSLRFKVKRADGSELAPASDVSLARDMTFNERDALAKQDEADALHRAMQTDIISQVLRRLSAIQPEQLRTPAEAPKPASVSASGPAAPQP